LHGICAARRIIREIAGDSRGRDGIICDRDSRAAFKSDCCCQNVSGAPVPSHSSEA
jgi:hypothetical protein